MRSYVSLRKYNNTLAIYLIAGGGAGVRSGGNSSNMRWRLHPYWPPWHSCLALALPLLPKYSSWHWLITLTSRSTRTTPRWHLSNLWPITTCLLTCAQTFSRCECVCLRVFLGAWGPVCMGERSSLVLDMCIHDSYLTSSLSVKQPIQECGLRNIEHGSCLI